MPISYVAKGTTKSAVNSDLKGYTHTLSTPWPTHAVEDIGFLQVITVGQTNLDVSTVKATVYGWNEIVPARYILNNACCQLFWARANTANMPAAPVVRTYPTGKYALTLAYISTFRGCTLANPPFESMAINNQLVTTTTNRHEVPRTGTSTGSGRYGVVFCAAQISYRDGIIYNNYTEKSDVINEGYYQAALSLFTATNNNIKNVGQYGEATYIERSANLPTNSIYSTVNLLLIPYAEESIGNLVLNSDFYFNPFALVLNGTVEATTYSGNINFNFDNYITFTGVKDLYSNDAYITYNDDFYFTPRGDVDLNKRAYIKSLFYPGKTPGYSEFSELIDFVTSDLNSSINYIGDKTGYLESLVTVSGYPNLDTITGSNLFETLMNAETTAALVDLVTSYKASNLVDISTNNILLGVGLSANATSFNKDNNPITLGLEKQITYTTASATNILINQNGFVTFSYCTTQSTQILNNDQYNSTGTFTLNSNTNMFELTYIGVTNSANATRMYTRFNGGTNYSFVGTSSARTSAAGLPLHGINRTNVDPKSGVINGYNMGSQWYIFLKGHADNITVGMVTVTAAISSISFISDTGGSPLTGMYRLVEFNYGSK